MGRLETCFLPLRFEQVEQFLAFVNAKTFVNTVGVRVDRTTSHVKLLFYVTRLIALGEADQDIAGTFAQIVASRNDVAHFHDVAILDEKSLLFGGQLLAEGDWAVGKQMYVTLGELSVLGEDQ